LRRSGPLSQKQKARKNGGAKKQQATRTTQQKILRSVQLLLEPGLFKYLNPFPEVCAISDFGIVLNCTLQLEQLETMSPLSERN
jgi:hypothetical protein